MAGTEQHRPSGSDYHEINISGHARAQLGDSIFHNYYNTPDQLSSDKKKTEAILQRLWFPRMEQRHRDVHEADEHAYHWAFEQESPARNWLESGSGIFWVTGWAGSGKSTFMKFLSQHSETQSSLETWAASKKLVRIEHYFWYLGSDDLQKSREGLLRSLLYHALVELPYAVPLVLPSAWSTWHVPEAGLIWTERELFEGLKNLARIPDVGFCFFIDGLDEYKPSTEHGNLVRHLKDVVKSGNIKLCLSSRPWQVFETHFGSPMATLRLQEKTRKDIEDYASVELKHAEEDAGTFPTAFQNVETRLFRRHREPYVRQRALQAASLGGVGTIHYQDGCNDLANEDMGEQKGDDHADHETLRHAEDLILSIVKKAQGVFLWVHLVLQALREEIEGGKSVTELERYVDEVPGDLMKYFNSMIRDRIGRRSEKKVARVLKVVSVLSKAEGDSLSTGSGFLSFLHFYHLQHYSGLDDPHFATSAPMEYLSDGDLRSFLRQTRSYLGALCKDLVRIEENRRAKSGFWLASLNVEFLHRSVFDYLLDGEMQGWMDETVPDHLRRGDLLARLALARLKLVHHRIGDRREGISKYSHLGDTLIGIFHVYEASGQSEAFDLECIRTKCSEIEPELVSQYEGLILDYWQKYGLWATGSKYLEDLGLPALFASYGLFRCLRIWPWISPSYVRLANRGGYFHVPALQEALDALFVDQHSSQQFAVIETLLDCGVYCETETWHRFIRLWWLLETFGKLSSPCGTIEWRPRTPIALCHSMWPVVEKLIRSGVDWEADCCVSLLHYGKTRCDADCYTNCSTGDSAIHSQHTPIHLLGQLVSGAQQCQLQKLFGQYADESARRENDKMRRNKRASCLRKAREHWLADGESSLEVNIHVIEEECWFDLSIIMEKLQDCDSDLRHSIKCDVCGMRILVELPPRWMCLDCLDKDYCAFCALASCCSQSGHRLYCIMCRDGAGWDKLHMSLDNALRLHERTRDLQIGEARALLKSYLDPLARQHPDLLGNEDVDPLLEYLTEKDAEMTGTDQSGYTDESSGSVDSNAD